MGSNLITGHTNAGCMFHDVKTQECSLLEYEQCRMVYFLDIMMQECKVPGRVSLQYFSSPGGEN